MSEETKLIILDRDGVINHDSDEYIKSPEEWIPLSGSLEAISRLNKLGYKVAIATNQSGISRGFYDLKTLESMHTKMRKLLSDVSGKIDYIAYCPHGPNDGCSCRKPKPGMLLEIAKAFSVQPNLITFIGDTSTDRKAAHAAEMNFVLVKTGKGARTVANEEAKQEGKYPVYDSLFDFVESL